MVRGILFIVAERITEKVEVEPASCGLCGQGGLVVERHRNRRRGLNWVNPMWRAEERTYRVCPTCHARQRLIDGHPI